MKKTITRQQLRRDARRNGLERCKVCGKCSTRCNLKIHAIVEARKQTK